MTTATNWLLNWAIAYSTPYMVNEGDGYANLQSKVFFVWGSFCLVSIAFVWLMIYETKGLTLEQVDELYGMVTKAWKSKEFRPALSFVEAEEMAAQDRKMSIRQMSVAAQERRKSAGHVHKEKGFTSSV
jgi:MFS transporter, SP family, sugar:H+ symporter